MYYLEDLGKFAARMEEACKRISAKEIMKYHKLYEENGMTLKKCTNKNIII